MKTMLVGIALTLWLGYSMHHDQDWSAGQGKVPREYVADYLKMAYDQGRGEDAAKTYFLPTTVDHDPQAADRRNGPPIHHSIKAIIADGMTVAVYHHIDATGTDPSQDAVDIYTTKKGRIIERQRIRQIADQQPAATGG